jgi:hypothetical protein
VSGAGSNNSPKHLTEIELKDLEEANDRKFNGLDDFDSDSDSYYNTKNGKN